MTSKPAEVEPEIAAVLAAMRIIPDTVTFINNAHYVAFSIDVGKGGHLRLIYSSGFLDVLRAKAHRA